MLHTLHSMAASTASLLASAFLHRSRPRPTDVLAIANAVLDEVDRSGSKANMMRVQRLVILSQCWSIAMFDRPMFKDAMRVVAGRPHLEAIHMAFRSFGSAPVIGRARIPEVPQFDWPSDQDQDRLEIIRSVVAAYARFDDYRLGQILSALLGDTTEGSIVDQSIMAKRLMDEIPA